MELNGSTIQRTVASELTIYKPEVKNGYHTKAFELKDNFAQLLDRQNALSLYGSCIVNECKGIIEKVKVRQYINAFTLVDNMNLPTCLGLNKLGGVYTYTAIYDISNLFPVLLGAYFNTPLDKVEDRLAKLIVNEDISYFQFLGAFSSRWASFKQGIPYKLLEPLIANYNFFKEETYKEYQANNICLGGIKLDKGIYSYQDVLCTKIDFAIAKLQEQVLYNIMKFVVEDNNDKCNIAIQTKGYDNVIIQSNNIEIFKPLVIKYGKFNITIEPTITRGDLGTAFIKYRTENFALLTADLQRR